MQRWFMLMILMLLPSIVEANKMEIYHNGTLTSEFNTDDSDISIDVISDWSNNQAGISLIGNFKYVYLEIPNKNGLDYAYICPDNSPGDIVDESCNNVYFIENLNSSLDYFNISMENYTNGTFLDPLGGGGSAENWTFTIRISDTKGTIDPSDDIIQFEKTIICDEGDEFDVCTFGDNITTLNSSRVYYLQIQANTTEADFNYDADNVDETFIASDSSDAGNQCRFPWNDKNEFSTVGEFVIKSNLSFTDSQPNFVPDDGFQDVPPFPSETHDVIFWTTETCDESICNLDTDYRNDSLMFEENGNECVPIGGSRFLTSVDFRGTENSALDSDPESSATWPNGDANTDRFESGKQYFFGVIFLVDDDWIDGDVDVEFLRINGEAGDKDTEAGWSWNISGIPPVDVTPPIVVIEEPQNETIFIDGNATDVFVRVTCTDDTDPDCDTVIDELNQTLNFTLVNTTQNNWTTTMPDIALGTHTIRIFANDSQNNRNDDETVTFTIAQEVPVVPPVSQILISVGGLALGIGTSFIRIAVNVFLGVPI